MSPLYQPDQEHDALRDAVRALAEKEIRPHAADVDACERYPAEALEALVRSAFHAIHLPERYGGHGADAVATCILIEEVARACASSSIIPAVNKAGHDAAAADRRRRPEAAGPARHRARRVGLLCAHVHVQAPAPAQFGGEHTVDIGAHGGVDDNVPVVCQFESPRAYGA